MSPTVLIFGSGAIGTVYAYLFVKASCSVVAVCRSNYAVASQSGFHIDSDLYGKGIHIQPKVVRTPLEAADDGPFDYVIVTCKAIPGAKTPEAIAPAITPGHTTIALIQNGIGIEDEYAALFPSNPLLSCVVYLPTTQTSPGYVSMGNTELLEIGTFPTSATSTETVRSRAETLAALLRSAGGNPKYDAQQDIQEKRWSKLLLNAAWNPICALTLSRDLPFLASSPDATQVVRGVLFEVAAVAQALGYTAITSAVGGEYLRRAHERPDRRGIEPSMLADALHARPMEFEAILGAPLRIAQNLGIEVPRLEMLYALTKALDASNRHRQNGNSLEGGDLDQV